jgi:hypothetical protein
VRLYVLLASCGVVACGFQGDTLTAAAPFATAADSAAIARVLGAELRESPKGTKHLRLADPCRPDYAGCRFIGDWVGKSDLAERFMAPVRATVGDTIPLSGPARASCSFSTVADSGGPVTHDYIVRISPPVFDADSATVMISARCENNRGHKRSGFAADERLTFKRGSAGWKMTSRQLTRIT